MYNAKRLKEIAPAVRQVARRFGHSRSPVPVGD
jgi:hypothetical protein